jgi:hypothetical protein
VHEAALPPTLRRARDALRRLPADNPRWSADALLAVAGAATQAAIYCEAARHAPAADGFTDIAAECRRLAAEAERLAPVFAPPAPMRRAEP